MNATGFVLASLLLVVLIAVAFGAQQMESINSAELKQVMLERDKALSIAQEAKGQRDVAFGQLAPARERVAALEAELEANKAEVAQVTNDLQQAQQATAAQQAEINRLSGEKAQLEGKYSDLQRQYEQAMAADDQPLQIPVTNLGNQEQALCLPVAANEFKSQLGAGLAVLLGMVALSSGGYMAYRSDPNRKVTVKMSREQLREYARYQRERGKSAG